MIKLFNKNIYIFILMLFPLGNLFCMEMNIPIANPKPAIPVDAVSGVLAAFDFHSVVALGEGNHNNEQGHAFRLALIRDPGFPAVVNDIVVEFGNARYQEIMDRFVSGEEVEYAVLRQVWQNTTQCHPIWDVPIYEEFFRAVRAVNTSLPKEKQLRVLLGDPPFDWDSPNVNDFDKYMSERDSHPADLIQKEVIAKNRRALVIYGDNHFLRKELSFTSIDDNSVSEADVAPSFIALLERTSGIKAFTIKTYTSHSEDIRTLQPDIKSWHQPSLTKLRGTILGVQDYGFYYSGVVMMKMVNGKSQFFKVKPGQRMEEQFDALLYLGPISTVTYSELTVEQCSDSAYVEMRKHRMAFIGGIDWAENFQKFCKKRAGN